MVGKDEDKYLSAGQGASGGWKVYTVKTVDMERNRIYINDYSVCTFRSFCILVVGGGG